MSMYGQLDLLKLVGAGRLRIGEGAEAEEGLFIPFKSNPTIFNGKKGVYLNISVIERSQPDQYGSIAFVGTQISDKETRDKYTREDLKIVAPILGNLKGQASSGGGNYGVRTVSAASVQPVDDLPY